MKYLLTFTLILALAGAISCARNHEQVTATAPMIQGIKIETIGQQSVDESYEAVGTVRAKISSIVSSKVMGSIVAMKVREGDTVRAGQVLVEIDSREARIQTQKSGAGLVEMHGALDEIDRSIKPIADWPPLPSVGTNSCSRGNQSVRRNLTKCEPGMRWPMLKLKLPGECGNHWRRKGDRCWPVLIRRRRMSRTLRFIQASLELPLP